MHLLTKMLLKHKQTSQLHVCTFALTTGKYKLAAVSSFWRAAKVTLWVKKLDHPPLPPSLKALKEPSLIVITPNKNLFYPFKIVKTDFAKVKRCSKSTCSNIHTTWLVKGNQFRRYRHTQS